MSTAGQRSTPAGPGENDRLDFFVRILRFAAPLIGCFCATCSARHITLNRVNLDLNAVAIREVCDAGLLAGALTVVWQGGEVLQVNEIGYRDVDAGAPMHRDTLFRIASMTKPVTVAAVMSLVDDGNLRLKARVVRWAPSWPMCGCSTIRTARWTAPSRPGGPS